MIPNPRLDQLAVPAFGICRALKPTWTVGVCPAPADRGLRAGEDPQAPVPRWSPSRPCGRASALAAGLLRTVADPLLGGETDSHRADLLGLCHPPAAVGEPLASRRRTGA